MSSRPALPEVLRMLVRRRWLLLVPFAAGLAAAGPIGGLVSGSYAVDTAAGDRLIDRDGQVDHDSGRLEAQVAEAKRRLAEHEAQIEAFRERQDGELRAQLQRRQQARERARLELETASQAASAARARRARLEHQLSEARAVRPEASPSALGALVDEPVAPMSLAQQLALTKAQQELNRVRLGADHPSVITMDRAILELEARVAQQTSLPAPHPVLDVDEQTGRIRDLQADLDAAVDDVQARTEDETRARWALERPAAEPVMPGGDEELLALTQEYGALRLAYSRLLMEQEDARIAGQVTRTQAGAPDAPPDSTDTGGHAFRRLGATAVAPFTGLLMGLLLVAWVEHRDDRFRSAVDVTRALALPVLGVVSEMTTDDERVGQRRRTLALDAAGVVVLLGAIAVLAFWRFEA